MWPVTGLSHAFGVEVCIGCSLKGIIIPENLIQSFYKEQTQGFATPLELEIMNHFSYFNLPFIHMFSKLLLQTVTFSSDRPLLAFLSVTL